MIWCRISSSQCPINQKIFAWNGSQQGLWINRIDKVFFCGKRHGCWGFCFFLNLHSPMSCKLNITPILTRVALLLSICSPCVHQVLWNNVMTKCAKACSGDRHHLTLTGSAGNHSFTHSLIHSIPVRRHTTHFHCWLNIQWTLNVCVAAVCDPIWIQVW